MVASTVSPRSRAQLVDQLQHLLLVADVQRARSARRAAAAARPGPAPGPGTPAAARRRRASPARRPANRLRSSRSSTSSTAARSAPTRGPAAAMYGRAAEQHVVEHRHAGRHDGLLRHGGDEPGPARGAAARRSACRRGVIVPVSGSSAADRPQQGRLARAVGADDGDPLARRPRSGRRRAGSASPPSVTRDARRRADASYAHPPGGAQHQDEERRAEERGDHADRQLAGRDQRCARPGRPAPGTPRRTAATAAGSTGS